MTQPVTSVNMFTTSNDVAVRTEPTSVLIMTAKQPTKPEETSRPIAARVPVAMVEAIDAWARRERKRTGDNISQSKAIAMLLAASLGTDENGLPLPKPKKAAR